MNKKKRIMFFLIAVQLFCAAAAFAQNGVITELSGTVELKRAGQAAFIAGKVGDPVARDTIISTGFKSTALVTVGSSIITVRPLTRLSLSELSSSAGTETINVNLQAGRVRVDVSPPAGTRTTMEVRGPNATASVRGTILEVDTRNLEVLEGVVHYKGNRGGTMVVSKGSKSRIDSYGKPSDPIVTNAAELMPLRPVGVGLTGGGGRGTEPNVSVDNEIEVTITPNW